MYKKPSMLAVAFHIIITRAHRKSTTATVKSSKIAMFHISVSADKVSMDNTANKSFDISYKTTTAKNSPINTLNSLRVVGKPGTPIRKQTVITTENPTTFNTTTILSNVATATTKTTTTTTTATAATNISSSSSSTTTTKQKRK
uniref:Uncharacterized protein n=1 Tax=Glossina morsitans morsitans TaxID=37546 RepID=A0A1B0F9S3_GLOMM